MDSFDDLYSSNAPRNSIAAGADFGRLSGIAALGIETGVSTLERLLLAEARCHHVVYKVVSYGNETDRKRLHGHSIVCPQASEKTPTDFGMAALRAAFAAVRVVFVGPSGEQGKLERAALKIDDLRLRPHIIFNFLTTRHALHGGPAPPTVVEVERLITEHGGLRAHIKKHARHVHDVSVERATAPSDVANVRSAAQSAECANIADEAEADADAPGEALAPLLSAVGVLLPRRQRHHAPRSQLRRWHAREVKQRVVC